MKLKRILITIISTIGLFGTIGCSAASNGFVSITPQEAKKIMDTEKGYVIVDVRNADEYAQGHIPNAKLLPLPSIENIALNELPDKKQLLIVYCRSGVRSKKAADILAKLGYTNIKEFGGIIDWPYEIVKEIK